MERLKIKSTLVVGLLIGIIGGLLTPLLHKGPWILPVGFLLPVISVFVVKIEENENKYVKLFFASFWTCIVFLILFNAYMYFFGNQLLPKMVHNHPLKYLKLCFIFLGATGACCSILTLLVTRRL
jgi:hypothetical protein